MLGTPYIFFQFFDVASIAKHPNKDLTLTNDK